MEYGGEEKKYRVSCIVYRGKITEHKLAFPLYAIRYTKKHMIRTIISILGLIIAGAVFFLYAQPAYNSTHMLQAQINQYNQALEKSAELQKLKNTLLSRRNAFDPSAIDALHKMVPDHVNNIQLILDLDSVAGRFGMSLQNVVISNPASESSVQTAIGAINAGKQKYDSLTLKFTTRGSYSNFVQFMEELESSLRIVDVVSLTVSPEGSINRILQADDSARATVQLESLYRYDITIRTYWLR